MDPETLLQTHAEVAIALAGFASVVAALSRPLSVFSRQRFLSLLALALIQVVGCLLPLWAIGVNGDSPATWRLLSLFLLGLMLTRLWWLVIVPNRSLGDEERMILSPFIHRATWAVGLLSLTLFLLNGVGLPLPPSFDLYYAGLFAGLMPGFALFADVATGS